MKTLLLLACLIFTYSWGKTYTCAFHQYEHSNHYQSKRGSAKDFLAGQPKSKPQTENNGHRRILYGAGRPPMRITLNTDDFDTIKPSENNEPQTTRQKLNFIKKAM